MALVSISEYARMKGISHAAIHGKIRRGIITKKALVKVEGFKKPRIDTEVADLELEFYGDSDKSAGHAALHPQANGSDAAADEGINRYRDAKVSTETLKARKLELEVAQREGRLLDTEEVRKRITKLVGETKDAILNVPAKIAPLLVSITDPVEMETKLLEELNEALSNLSRLKF